jgi:hypothetical protein
MVSDHAAECLWSRLAEDRGPEGPMKQTLRIGLGVALFAITGMSATALAANQKPNVVIMLADTAGTADRMLTAARVPA